jgi:hypothetical protein
MMQAYRESADCSNKRLAEATYVRPIFEKSIFVHVRDCYNERGE